VYILILKLAIETKQQVYNASEVEIHQLRPNNKSAYKVETKNNKPDLKSLNQKKWKHYREIISTLFYHETQ
jgi:hypothetical protein